MPYTRRGSRRYPYPRPAAYPLLIPYFWWWPWPPQPEPSNCVELCDEDLDTVYSALDNCRTKLGAWLAKVKLGVMQNVTAEDLVELAQDCRQYVDELYSMYVPDFTPNIVEVTDDWIVNRLALLPNYTSSRRIALDGRYYTASLDDLKRIVYWDRTNKHKYYEDRFDCDKYAMYFKANVAWYFGINAVAVVIDNSAGHAYNLLFPSDQGQPYVYDPSNNDYLAPLSERDTSKYKLEDYVVIV